MNYRNLFINTMPYFEIQYDNPVSSDDDFRIISVKPTRLIDILFRIKKPYQFIVTGYSNHKTNPKIYYINMNKIQDTSILFLKYTVKFIKVNEFIDKL